MSALAEKTRLYQAALEEWRIRRDRDPEAEVAHIELELVEARREMETAWLEATYA